MTEPEIRELAEAIRKRLFSRRDPKVISLVIYPNPKPAIREAIADVIRKFLSE